MNKYSINQKLFLDLIKAGLWEQDVLLPKFDSSDFYIIYRLASEQAVVGLLASGLEHVVDKKAPQDLVLSVVGDTLLLEKCNKAMNIFIADLMMKLKEQEIFALLVKGQGLAQCYERPLWRASGDVDLFLDLNNYLKAKDLLYSLSTRVEEEDVDRLHISFEIQSWVVELHGTLRPGIGKRIDLGIDSLQKFTFEKKDHYRIWETEGTRVYLPAPSEDVIYVFVHILQHFFQGGIGLRQICDWCRLLWMYHHEIEAGLLEDRLVNMGIIRQWRSFAALVVGYLGMPKEYMPLYSSDTIWKRNAERLLNMILESGNFGRNRIKNNREKYPIIIKKILSFESSTWYSIHQFFMFPRESMVTWNKMFTWGVKEVVRVLFHNSSHSV